MHYKIVILIILTIKDILVKRTETNVTNDKLVTFVTLDTEITLPIIQKETGAEVTIVTIVALVTLATDVTSLARVMMLKKHNILLCQTSRSAHSLPYV